MSRLCLLRNSGVKTPAAGPSREEVWHWDTRGYLVCPQIMDAAWLRQANDVLDSEFTRKQRQDLELVPGLHDHPRCSPLIAPAAGTPDISILCDPF
jgi:hypothetical protein